MYIPKQLEKKCICNKKEDELKVQNNLERIYINDYIVIKSN